MNMRDALLGADLFGSTSGEPDAYLKNASVSGKTLTITKKDNSTVVYAYPNNVSAFDNDSGYLTEHQSLSGYATENWVTSQSYATQSQAQGYATTAQTNAVASAKTYTDTQIAAIDVPEVINNVTSTSTTDALSANMGKSLQDQITNLSTLGRFLAIWNSTTGLPITDPAVMPYTYKTGDYYIIGDVGGSGAVNYKPDGSTYNGQPSTTVETYSVKKSDVYYYDGTAWAFMAKDVPQVAIDDAMSTTSTNAVQNRVITAAVNAKQDTLTAGSNITIENNVISATDTIYTLPAATSSSLGGVKIGNSLSIDASNIVNVENVPYVTTAPVADNTNGLKVCVLSSEPATKYNGWLYFIQEV